MGKINISPSQFEDVIVAFLLDKMIHPEEIAPSNIEFTKLIDDMKGKGMKSKLLQYYLKMDSNLRLYYKRIKPSLEIGATSNSVVNIMPFLGPEEVEKKGFLKKIVKKLLMKEDINEQERQLLMEEYKDE